MKKKTKKYLVFLLVLVIFMVGCGEKEIQQTKMMRVGIVLYTQDDPFINALTDCLKQDFMKLESSDRKISMTVRDGKSDQSVQDDVVEGMIDAGCDVLCVDLVDRTAPSKIIEMAKAEGIPIIFFNREPVKEDLMQWDKMYYIGGDAEQSGVMQGEIAAQVIQADAGVDKNHDGKIQYVLLQGEAGHQDAIIRTECSVRTLIESGIELEKLSYQFADWSRAQAENKMTQLITEYGDGIELILANNDEMALGAVAAYDKLSYSMDRRPVILGIDGLNEVLTAIVDDRIQGTVYNDKEGQARQMAKLAVDLFEGNEITQYEYMDGKYIILPYSKVDKSNISEYIEAE